MLFWFAIGFALDFLFDVRFVNVFPIGAAQGFPFVFAIDVSLGFAVWFALDVLCDVMLFLILCS